MADGSIVFSTELDNKTLEKQLSSITKKISATEDKINQKLTERSPLAEQANQLAVYLDSAKAQLEYMKSGAKFFSNNDIREQAETVRVMQKEWNTLQGRVERYDAAIKSASIELDRNKAKAGAVAQKLSKASGASEKMSAAVNQANTFMTKLAGRITMLVKQALVFYVITRALIAIREWLGKVIKSSPEAAAAIGKLKAALLTLAQPFVDVIIPAFVKFVGVLSDVTTQLARIVSLIFGTTYEKSKQAAEALNEQTSAFDNTGKAAKKASKQLAAFDELNVLNSNDNTDDNPLDKIIPDFSGLGEGFLSNLTFSLEDILFKWKDLTKEDILVKLTTALTTLAGAVIGFEVGGLGGAVIGITVGAVAGLLLSNILFDGDGVLNEEELLNSVVLALTTLAGLILGFMVGGPGGAAIGVTVGAGITLAVSKLLLNGDGKLSEEEIIGGVVSALTTLAGFVLGIIAGGPAGAAIGILLGADTGLTIKSLVFDNDGVLSREEIAKLIVDVLGLIVGGVLGFFATKSAKGALIGMTVGAGMSLLIGNLLFDNDGVLSREEIAKLLVVVLTALVGSVIGFFATKNASGAVIGITVGAGIGLLIDNLLFDNDGVLSKEEIIKSVVVVLTLLAGSVIGFFAGGPGGAAIGATVGAGIGLVFDNLLFDNDGVLSDSEIADLLVVVLTALVGGVIGFVATKNASGAIIGVSVATTMTLLLKKLNFSGDDETTAPFLSNDWWYELFAGHGRAASDGLSDGANDGMSEAKKEWYDWAWLPWNWFAETNEIHSPSKLFERGGENIIQGIINGLNNKDLSVTAQSIWESVKRWWNTNVTPKLTLSYWQDKFNGIKEGLVSTIKNAVNGGISLFNKFIDWINDKLNISWNSFSLFGNEIIPAGSFQLLTLPKIPMLAEGAVIPPNREFMAVLGDQKSGQNIEAPENLIRKIVREETGNGDGGGDLTANISVLLDGEVIYRNQQKVARRRGKKLVEGDI